MATAMSFGLIEPREVAKAVPRETCTNCGARAPREEVVRCQGQCLYCFTDAETRTMMLDDDR